MRNPYYLHDAYLEYLNSLKTSNDQKEVTALLFEDWIWAARSAGKWSIAAKALKTTLPAGDDWSDMDEDQAELNRFIEDHDKPRAKPEPQMNILTECQLICEAYHARKQKGLYVKDLEPLFTLANNILETVANAHKELQLQHDIIKNVVTNKYELDYDTDEVSLHTIVISDVNKESDELPF